MSCNTFGSVEMKSTTYFKLKILNVFDLTISFKKFNIIRILPNEHLLWKISKIRIWNQTTGLK
jgi:hypothetical protein